MTDSQSTIDDFEQQNNQEQSNQNDQPSEKQDNAETVSQDNSTPPESTSGENSTDDLNSAEDRSGRLNIGGQDPSDLRFGKDPKSIDVASKWARRYLAHRCANTLKNKPLSEGSFNVYLSIIREYVNFLHDHDQTVLDAGFSYFEEYILYCIDIGRRGTTVNLRVSATKQLYLHIQLNEEVDSVIDPLQFDQLDREAIDELAKNAMEREALTMDELELLFEAMDTDRNRLIAVVGTETGFRNSDIRNIRLMDIDFDEPSIYAQDPKNGKPYTVPISEELALELQIYIEKARESDSGNHKSTYLFPSKISEKLQSNNTLCEIISNAAKEAGIQEVMGITNYSSKYLKQEEVDMQWNKVTPHVLRHSFITLLEKEDVPLEYRRLLANHSSADTTERYSHGKTDVLKEAQSRIDIV